MVYFLSLNAREIERKVEFRLSKKRKKNVRIIDFDIDTSYM